MDFITTLQQVDTESLYTFLYYWGSLSLVSAGIIVFGKQLPMSNKVANESLRRMGSMDKKTGWVVMEIPILIVVIYFFFAGDQPLNPSAIIVGVFVMHYFNRAMIYPHRIKVKGKTMPVSSVVSSMIFYIINGYVIGHYFGALKTYPIEWLSDPRFIIGMTLFLSGFVINIHSDNILINLRKPGETGYKIPQGGVFRWVSCPNYLGECMEWVGFALMTWCLPGFVYAIWVVLPVLAQAIGNHNWYKETFKDEYPKERKAVIPYIL